MLPKPDQFVFSPSGGGLYEGLYEFRDDLAEVYRRLAYDFDRFWDGNDRGLARLLRAFRIGALALAIEIVALVTLVSDTLF